MWIKRSTVSNKSKRQFSDTGLTSRCSKETLDKVREFKVTRDELLVPDIVSGILERFVDSKSAVEQRDSQTSLDFKDDLGIDSLTRIEVAMLLEEAFEVPFSNQDLIEIKTLDDLIEKLLEKTDRSS